MAQRILVLTVGGSCEPIVNAIREEKPIFTYFICSGGSRGSHAVVSGNGKPCSEKEETRPSIVAQTGLLDNQYKIIIVEDPDDMDSCYSACENISQEIKAKFKDSDDLEVIANYTGGTKTMSSALVVYALDSGWTVKFNIGPRDNLVKIHGGDIPARIKVEEVIWKRKFDMANLLVENYYYAEAQELLESILKQSYLTGSKKQTTIICKEICRAFNLWDRFNHEEARSILERYARFVTDQFVFLKRILGKANPQTGYEKVVDLILNADRRKAQKRYDDAVARLYRAVEMFAQTRLLKNFGIDTGNVDVTKLPESIRNNYNIPDTDGKIRIGLRKAYDLLHNLGDELGAMFKNRENRIADALKKRNESILAHGTMPLGESDYQTVSSTITEFLEYCLAKVRCPKEDKFQFPRSISFCFD